MRFVIYTNSVSAHQLPLAREIVKRVGEDNFRYIYTGEALQGGAQEVQSPEPWILKAGSSSAQPVAEDWLENAEVMLVGGLRPIDLLERRSARGLRTFYQSERWFKPIPIRLPLPRMITDHCPLLAHVLLLGTLRLLFPSYRRMAHRFLRLMNSDPNFMTLAIGLWAKRDFLRLGVREDKIIDWGYFVEPSSYSHGVDPKPTDGQCGLRVLWVGRPLWLKRVDTIRKAVAQVSNATLDIFTNIPPAQVREEMRKHDVFVLSSNALEGWGATLSEAMMEGMLVLGSNQAGASATLLPPSHRFDCGDYKRLAFLLEKASRGELPHVSISSWTTERAASRLFAAIQP